ncbi:hypothetical protein KC19_6G099800 [Ceratodon purpureus]|uniref:Uncharacterized protein n=1 Tax=Ceratodon purpureus TaxID=3225 RepID=A0A8T0HH98_CERPU|nr:hypothetical protein KC19_6G099800 [Ceratodon purpureus]
MQTRPSLQCGFSIGFASAPAAIWRRFPETPVDHRFRLTTFIENDHHEGLYSIMFQRLESIACQLQDKGQCNHSNKHSPAVILHKRKTSHLPQHSPLICCKLDMQSKPFKPYEIGHPF